MCVLFNAAKANAAISVARAFYELARQNNTQKIESLLHRGYSLESVGENGYNPICMAVARQDKGAYKVLLSYGANKNPECLQKVPESSYRRFFGVKQTSKPIATYRSDTPYKLGTAILGGGAIAAAFALKGGTGGSGGKSPVSPSDPERPDEPEEPEEPEEPTYEPIENCIDQQKEICKKCKDGYILQNNKCILPTECPENSTYNDTIKKCVCNFNYDHHGDAPYCYKTVSNCKTQYKEECTECKVNFYLKDNFCYPSISKCEVQNGDICTKCESGYGVHNGSGKICYKDIENCENGYQKEDRCERCIGGYGTHGDPTLSQCYKDVNNCITYSPADREFCTVCEEGYETHGDGKCYEKTFCDQYPNTIPIDGKCVCDTSRGYEGEPGSCSQTVDDEKYSEGDGNIDEWINLNERYCNSQGVYDAESKLCDCNKGYAGADCSKCDESEDADGRLYLPFDGRCYRNEKCNKDEKRVQLYSDCVCMDGFTEIEGACVEKIECGLGKEQFMPGTDPLEVCRCKPNFIATEDGECECPAEKIDGKSYIYDALSDQCVLVSNDCSDKNNGVEKWSGENCDICESQYAITKDANGEHCGLQCASNRADIKLNPTCENCATGYEYNELAATCIKLDCIDVNTGELIKGYIQVDGVCSCDEANGYAMNMLGVCQLKGEPLIGVKDDYYNNKTITLENVSEFRDIYGMKPVKSIDENGKETYFDSVYNSLNHGNATINIKNQNSGNINIYGIYSPSVIYNSASLGQNVNSAGRIIVEDTDTASNIYGLYNVGNYNVYNAFSHNNNQEKTTNNSLGEINIEKKKTNNGISGGNVVGIIGNKNIYNSFATAQDSAALNSVSKAIINITHEGVGNITGISNVSKEGITSNAYAYLDAAASNVKAEAEIVLEGNSRIIGIEGRGKIVNSETQFQKNYNMIENLEAKGTINVTSNSSAKGEGAYGIFSKNNEGKKADVINASGYNSTGNIIVKNTKGGMAYGIYSENQRYIALDENGEAKRDENGELISLYNTVYNAFRSSRIYGGENVAAKGNIEVAVSGEDGNDVNIVGISSLGDVFNAYTKPRSDVKLETIGSIKVTDISGSEAIYTKGIEASGGTIANAYSYVENEFKNKNEASITKGTIEVTKDENSTSKSTLLAGIYSDRANDAQGTNIINAGLVNNKNKVEGSITVTARSMHDSMYGIYANTNLADSGQNKTVYNAYYSNDEGISEGTVIGNILVKTESLGYGAPGIYGIYVKEGIAHNAYSTNENANVIGNISVEAYGGQTGGELVGMYGYGGNSKLYNEGKSTITVKSIGRPNFAMADAYGMKSINGTIVNDAKIDVFITRPENTQSKSYGLYVKEGTAENHENGIITVSGNNKNYGMYADVSTSGYSATVKNNGIINVLKGLNNYGMYADITKNNSVINIANSKTINVSGDGNNYGIYAKISDGVEGTINVENSGTINLSGTGTNIGIYASGKGVTVTNTNEGKIIINDSDSSCTGEGCNNASSIVLENDAKFITEGAVASSTSIDLAKINGDVIISKGGSFVAPTSISGDLGVSSAVVEDNYEKTTSIKDAVKSENVDNLNLQSKSYMYNASLKQTSTDNYDVDMTLKDFNDITTKDKAKYYALNYNENNKDLFNILKKQETATAFASAERNLTGEYVLPNIIEEELKVSRSLDKTMVSDLFTDTDKDIRQFVGADAIFVGRDDTTSLTGYELDSQTMYTMYDKKLNNKYRLGLGISFTHTNTDYNNDSSRKNFMVQGYVPLTMKFSDKLMLASIAKLGYQDGEYTRYGYDNRIYKADTSAITYGLLNELRYNINLNGVNLSPFMGLNLNGWYNNSVDESGDSLAINMASSHVLSLESALGLYLNKEIEINETSKLSTTLGFGYYHEFLDPYNSIKAKHANKYGSYRLRNHVADSKDRGAISAKINYDYKDFSIYGELMQYLEDKYPFKVDLGLRYKF